MERSANGPTTESVQLRSRLTASWSRNAEALFRSSARSIVVLAPNASEPVRLGGTAAAVFAALEAPCAESALVDALRNQGADEASVREAIAMLGDAGIITTLGQREGGGR